MRTLCALLLLVPPAAGQIAQFESMPKRDFPLVSNGLGQAIGDFDRDGDADIVVLRNNDALLFSGNGRGDFQVSAIPAVNQGLWVTYRAIAAGDVDADGDLDLVLGAGDYIINPGIARLFRNDGKGKFTLDGAAIPRAAGANNAVALGDVDGDGDLDLVVGNGSSAWVPGTRQTQLYLNDGRGRFTDVTTSHMPLDSDETTALALGDIDGDNDLDLLIGNYRTSSSGATKLYSNDGKGRFTDVTASRFTPNLEPTLAVVFIDVDGDKDLDFVVGNDGGYNDRLYLNNGRGSFTPSSGIPGRPDTTRCVSAGDLDGDGDTDLFLGGWFRDRLYENDGRGGFKIRWLEPSETATISAACADIDGDKDIDLFVADLSGPCKLHVNDGNQRLVDVFEPAFPRLIRTQEPSAVAFGDLDGDGDEDCVTANIGGILGAQNQVFLGDGYGRFSRVEGRLPQAFDPSTATRISTSCSATA